MKDEVKLTLPMPPTDNRYYGNPKGSPRHKFITKAAKVFRHEAAVIVATEGLRGHFGKDKVFVQAVLHLASGGDIWNRLKGLGDALEYSNLIDDDKQIDDSRIKRGHPVKGGRCEVTIWRI